MVKYTKESIQRLREAVDIIDILSRSLSLKRTGSTYKGLCPFHGEKTPSFTVAPSSRHYHCFGCGAHGDAVTFLMQHEGFSFTQSVEFLAERYNIQLQEERRLTEHEAKKNFDNEAKKFRCKQALDIAKNFFHTILLYDLQAQHAREYLFQRGICLSFIQSFHLGYSIGGHDLILKKLLNKEGFYDSELAEAGLLHSVKEDSRSSKPPSEFFCQRIMFPILDHMGTCIGFSARKIQEETFGGKYINTSETVLFKKSKVLFGLSYCKKRIVRDRLAILVEGQLDALQLIYAGFDYTVATLGTAFGEAHIDILKTLGVQRVYLAFDNDTAGLISAKKAGNILMKKGIAVSKVSLKNAKDPDEFLLQYGRSQFVDSLMKAEDYIDFCVGVLKVSINWTSPMEKDKGIRELVDEIKKWDNPLLIHESLKRVAELVQVPLQLLQETYIEESKSALAPCPSPLPIQHQKKELLHASHISSIDGSTTCSVAALSSPYKIISQESASYSAHHREAAQHQTTSSITITSDIELELDLIRWVILLGSEMASIASTIVTMLTTTDFVSDIGKKMFQALHCIMSDSESSMKVSLLEFAAELDTDIHEEAYITYMISRPPIPLDKSKQHVYEAVKKIKDRAWIRQREAIRKKMLHIDSMDRISEDEQMQLAHEFSQLRQPVLPPLEVLFDQEERV